MMADYRAFTTPDRMIEIANRALDYVAEMFNGSYLYQMLSEDFGMTDEEIRAAGFSTLDEFMENKDQSPEQNSRRHHLKGEAR